MNSFANSLFALFFGWARTLIQQIWTSAAAGRYSGFLAWLGDHWLWLAAVLCVVCTVLDFVIWMIRWRPYLLWRTSLRRLLRRINPKNAENTWRFARGYEGGIALEMPPEDEAPSPPPVSWQEQEAWAQPSNENPPPEEGGQAEPFQPFPPADEAPVSPSDDRGRYFSAPTAYEPPPMSISTRIPSSRATDMPAARRKRRSEKYAARRADWRMKLMGHDEDEDALLDGLPPAVDKQQAFHAPVYPRQSPPQPQGMDAWRRPEPSDDRMDGDQTP